MSISGRIGIYKMYHTILDEIVIFKIISLPKPCATSAKPFCIANLPSLPYITNWKKRWSKEWYKKKQKAKWPNVNKNINWTPI